MIRVVLFDFRKALDLIDHNILVRKLSDNDIPNYILCWTADFLMNRRQRVKLAKELFLRVALHSSWGPSRDRIRAVALLKND